MSTRTEPTITHQPWCPPTGCDEERDPDGRLLAMYHWSEDYTWKNGYNARLRVVQVEGFGNERSDPPEIHVYGLHPDDALTADQLGDYAAWLRAQAARIGGMIAGTTDVEAGAAKQG
ncbi:hypothetical protein J4G33_07915 [Actinotalea sp. BY-33]|uniref:Uncharacterized protein n=1 Tax=Actinotalea soli TaxID=2819234 RepID=A0A939LS84_9CELL|nr:hypothetical protein [Actinotalea soli]MBO1751725.1 hypothetical protein [Actinotalea soli]